MFWYGALIGGVLGFWVGVALLIVLSAMVVSGRQEDRGH